MKSISFYLKSKSRNRSTYLVTATVPYAVLVEEGTEPHDIHMPWMSMGDVMAKGWRGNVPKRHYAGRVRHVHPGASPMYFMRDAFYEMDRRADNFLRGSFFDEYFR